MKQLFTGRRLVIGVLSLLVIIGLGSAILSTFKTYRVGTHSFTKSDLNVATDAQTKALKAAGSKSTSGADAAAQKQAVLLAALKTEADKRQITYSESDVDTILADSFKAQGGKNGYMSYMQATYGWNKDDVYRKWTIDYLEGKLAGALLSTRSYASVMIRWDNLKGYHPDDFKQQYAAKEQFLNTKYLPLFKQKASVATLAASVDVLDTMTQEQQTQIYQDTGGTPFVFDVETYGEGHSLDGFQKYPEGEDTATKLTALHNVGDYVGPFKANDGTLRISRLEKSSGGSYASWDAFTGYYQKQSGVSFGPSNLSKTVGMFKGGIRGFAELYMPKVVHAAAADCTAAHDLHYQISYIDANTNAEIASLPGYSLGVSATRSDSLCTKAGYTNDGFSVGSGSSYTVSKTYNSVNGHITVYLDCNGGAWNISNSNTAVVQSIPGYTYKTTAFASGQSNAYPYFSGINGSPPFVTYVKYTKNAVVLARSGSITCSTTDATSIRVTGSYYNSSSAYPIGLYLSGTVRQNYTGGDGSVDYTFINLTPGTNYVIQLRDKTPDTALSSINCATAGNPGVPPPPPVVPPPPPSASGGIGCYSADTNSITLSIDFDGTSNGAVLTKDGSQYGGLRPGPSEHDTQYVSGLQPSTGYSFTLVDVARGNTLGSATCYTAGVNNPPPPPPPANTGTGTLTCGASTATSITINYSYFNTANGTTVYYQDRAVSPLSLSTVGANATPGSQSGSYPATAQAGHSYGFSMQDNTTGQFIVDYNNPVICAANNPVTVTSGGTSNPGVDNDEDPTTVTPRATATTTPNSTPAASLQCTITVTKITYATSVTSPITTYGPMACTAGVQITGPATAIPGGGVAGDRICSSLKVTPGNGTVNSDGSVVAGSIPQYDETPPTCTPIKNKPFFKVFNSSVTTGGDVGGSPSPTTPGTLAGWYNNSPPGNGYGSSAQLGAYALVNITGFASNQTGSRIPTGLSFANSGLPLGSIGTGIDSPKLGGLLGGNGSITALALLPSAFNTGGGGPVNFNTLVNPASNAQPGAYSYSSNLILSNSPSKPVDPGQNRAIYVNGNIYIANDLYYNQAGWALGSLPSLVVVATGNIYIDKNVTHLDGTYEAQGSIYTCAENNTFGAIAAGSLYAKCGQQLTVTGSFVAKKINLLRTFGSLRDEKGAIGTCSSSNLASPKTAAFNNTCAAEVFEFSPEQYLQKPAAKNTGGTVKYDAITSLPPVL